MSSRNDLIYHMFVSHLCFNITEKGQMIVPALYNTILEYTRKYDKNYVFQWNWHENPIQYGLVVDFR